MKYLSFLSKLTFLFVVVFSLSSCGDDPIDNPIDESPTVNLSQDAGTVWEDGTNLAGETSFDVTVKADAGTAEMNTLEVFEDNVKVDLSRLSLNSNPVLLDGADRTKFEFKVTIELPATPGDYTYRFDVEDDAQLVGSTSVSITTLSAEPLVLTLDGSTSLTLDAPGSFLVALTATPATGSTLATITVQEDAVDMPIDRVKFGTTGTNVPFDANPFAIPAADQAGFTGKGVVITTPNAVGVTYIYTVVVTDDRGESQFVDIAVSITAPVSVEEYTAVVVNNADGPDFGGLDLSEGATVPAASADADIKDSGIDGDGNWLQTIEPANSSDLRLADASQPELFNYDNINTTDAVIAAFDAGLPISVSGTIAVDDVFVAYDGASYYILRVATVTNTAGDNTDFYEFDVKKGL